MHLQKQLHRHSKLHKHNPLFNDWCWLAKQHQYGHSPGTCHTNLQEPTGSSLVITSTTIHRCQHYSLPRWFLPTVHAPCHALLCHHCWQWEHHSFSLSDWWLCHCHQQESMYTTICNQLDSHLLVPKKRQGLLTHYNGMDIIQTSNDVTTLHVGYYVQRIVALHAG